MRAPHHRRGGRERGTDAFTHRTSAAGRVFSEKGNFDELTMKLYLGIGHSRTTRKMDNPGDGEDNPRLWWAGADHANYISLSADITNSFNQITQAVIPETMTLQFGLGVHTSVLGVPRSHTPGTQAHNAGLWWTSVDCAMRFYDHDCGG